MDEGCKADPNAKTPWEALEFWQKRAEAAEARVKELEQEIKDLWRDRDLLKIWGYYLYSSPKKPLDFENWKKENGL